MINYFFPEEHCFRNILNLSTFNENYIYLKTRTTLEKNYHHVGIKTYALLSCFCSFLSQEAKLFQKLEKFQKLIVSSNRLVIFSDKSIFRRTKGHTKKMDGSKIAGHNFFFPTEQLLFILEVLSFPDIYDERL